MARKNTYMKKEEEVQPEEVKTPNIQLEEEQSEIPGDSPDEREPEKKAHLTGPFASKFHTSTAKSKIAKAKKRGTGGHLLGKRQIQFKISYKLEEQKYELEAISGDAKIEETLTCGGMPRLEILMNRLMKKWRGDLV